MHFALVTAIAIVAVIAYRRGDPVQPFHSPVGLAWLPLAVLPRAVVLLLCGLLWTAYAALVAYLAFCIAWNWRR